MRGRKELEELFRGRGFGDFKWIDPKEIVIGQWVRMKCLFGCAEAGRNATCPPNVPTVAECEKFFHEYTQAAIFHFANKVDKPEDRHEWTKGVNLELLKLERELFLDGFEKVFLLFMDSCCLCPECPGKRTKCRNPRMARPSPESMAMDVFTTVRKVGYTIDVLYDYSQAMDRYAFMMIR